MHAILEKNLLHLGSNLGLVVNVAQLVYVLHHPVSAGWIFLVTHSIFYIAFHCFNRTEYLGLLDEEFWVRWTRTLAPFAAVWSWFWYGQGYWFILVLLLASLVSCVCFQIFMVYCHRRTTYCRMVRGAMVCLHHPIEEYVTELYEAQEADDMFLCSFQPVLFHSSWTIRQYQNVFQFRLDSKVFYYVLSEHGKTRELTHLAGASCVYTRSPRLVRSALIRHTTLPQDVIDHIVLCY